MDYTGSYDAWGNVTSQLRGGITRTPIYDGQDHLVRWSSSINNQEEWNLYDSSSERVLRRTYDGTNTVITVYAFGLEEHVYSYSGLGSSDTNTSNTYYYNLGGRLLGTWNGSSSTTMFLLTDTLGNVVSSFNNLASGAAVVLGNQVYGPYGNRRVQQGTISTSKGFTGQYNDFVTGLDYYNARYYDPVIGVFVSADTVQGNAKGMDPYSYVGGNPETMTDPTGHRFISGDTSVGSQTAVIEPNHVISIETPGQGTTIISPYVVGPTILPNPSLDQSKVTRALSSQHVKQNTNHPSSDITSCGAPVTQTTCGNYGVYYAAYTSTGFAFGIPGSWCFSCGGGGNDKNGDHSGSSKILTSTDEESGTINGNANDEANTSLSTGDLYERTIYTKKGPVSMLAEVVIEGDTLHLKDVVVYNEDTKPFTGLLRDMLTARAQIAEEIKALGFQNLRISGTRVSGSTSANPGKLVDLTIPLDKR